MSKSGAITHKDESSFVKNDRTRSSQYIFDLNKDYEGVCWDKPLIHQILKLSRSQYNDLVHRIVCVPRVFRFFENEFFELLSRASWWMVPLVWLPVTFLMLIFAVKKYNLGVFEVVMNILQGIFLWTLAEYTLHRYLFHLSEEFLPDHAMVRVLHFLCHGVHHLLIMDPYRLVLPPFLLIILMTPFYCLASIILPSKCINTIWSGILIGYTCYDLLHYASHHLVSSRFKYLNYIRRYHTKHHHRDPSRGFGVSSPIWDYIFITQLD